jgi:hypothetical protein
LLLVNLSLQPLPPTICIPLMDLLILAISHKWSHTVCDFCIQLLPLSLKFLRFIHIVAYINKEFTFSFGDSNYMYIRTLEVVLQITHTLFLSYRSLCSFSQPVFFLCFILGNTYCSVFFFLGEGWYFELNSGPYIC